MVTMMCVKICFFHTCGGVFQTTEKALRLETARALNIAAAMQENMEYDACTAVALRKRTPRPPEIKILSIQSTKNVHSDTVLGPTCIGIMYSTTIAASTAAISSETVSSGSVIWSCIFYSRYPPPPPPKKKESPTGWKSLRCSASGDNTKQNSTPGTPIDTKTVGGYAPV
ncbi:unnamed protein product [Pylaiella littoralis]